MIANRKTLHLKIYITIVDNIEPGLIDFNCGIFLSTDSYFILTPYGNSWRILFRNN
ncbi:MAG: hypothetical protein HeimC3_41390 [Candidatus Heimdallarchaeota archaeon LC_3]|nr:MAG: hypothetical protein HeimC3_41390 [Candidatus Heimdallarchaeota archaeon LC_3]